jgi:uncharacterized protein (DUF488 family)
MEVNELQKNILIVVDKWVREKKTPVPRQRIISELENQGVKSYTTINAINSVIKKGFIRKSCVHTDMTKTSYVQLATIHYE